MTGGDHLWIGLRSVRANKLRASLTVLGVVFGVGAVVSMLSIAGGARRVALEQIRLLGASSVRVSQLELGEEAREIAEQKGSRGLNLLDVEMLRGAVPGVSSIAPIRIVDAAVMRHGRETTARVVATNAEYAAITRLTAESGRFLGEIDVREAKRVVVLGSSARDELFAFQDPIGHDIRIGGVWFTVVGWTPRRAVGDTQSGPIATHDVNRDVYIPITAAQQRFPEGDRESGIGEVAIRLSHEELVPSAAEIIERLLLRSHRGADDFEVWLPAELLAQSESTQRVFNVVMGSIAAISLLVGGIGIMNVMLTTVTERTREIGIRRAVGASRPTILLQFLTETVVISGLGGILGIALGLGMAQAIHWYAGWAIAPSPGVMVVAVAISGLVGVLFGLVPARRAARMDPIAALRFE